MGRVGPHKIYTQLTYTLLNVGMIVLETTNTYYCAFELTYGSSGSLLSAERFEAVSHQAGRALVWRGPPGAGAVGSLGPLLSLPFPLISTLSTLDPSLSSELDLRLASGLSGLLDLLSAGLDCANGEMDNMGDAGACIGLRLPATAKGCKFNCGR